MIVHHLNCGSLHAYGFPSENGTGKPFQRGLGVIHCLLIDTGDGLVLVDTGWGIQDCAHPSPAVRQFAKIVGCPLDPRETAIRQVEALGYDPEAVRHIFLTHMHLDHAGGLPDFPQAVIHASENEIHACAHPRTLLEWRAYRPEHRAHIPRWQPHNFRGKHWFGLDSTRAIHIGDSEFLMVTFPGHTRGHCAVAVRTGAGWLLHCGDVYAYAPQVSPIQPYTHPCGRLTELIMTTEFHVPRRHWFTLRSLLQIHGDQVRTVCSHDAIEFMLSKDQVEISQNKKQPPHKTISRR